MPRLTLDEAHDALPHLEELRPVFDHLLVESQPDPTRTWSGSGRLGTLGSRLVANGSLAAAAGRLAEEHAARLGEVYAAVARVLDALDAGDRPAAAIALLDAAALEERQDRPERAEAYAAAAYRAARGEQDQGPAALSLRRWARATRALGRLSDALDRYARAYEAAWAISDASGAAEAALGAGNVLEDQGRWPEAARWYHTALEALDGVATPTLDRCYALLNLHIAARSRGAIDESVSWLERAQEAAGADAREAMPLIENARGQLSMARGAFAEAETHLRKALDAATDARARVTIRLNLAETVFAQGRTLDAAEQAREAERDAIRAGLVPKLPEVYRILGRIASAEGDPDAFVLFERALEIIRARSLPALEEAQTLQAYADAEAHRGDEEAARDLLRAAQDGFRALGITHMRQPWADVYGPGPNDAPLPDHQPVRGHDAE